MGPKRIRVGVGGWTYEPWRDNFYPAGLPQAQELHYASRRLGAIEINGTYYGTQKRDSFVKWRDETPDDFAFSLKASRYATNRRVLAEAGDSIARFVDSGITELGPKLGPVVWQFAPTKKFDADDFEAFVALLPASADGVALRHVLDVRHASFKTPAYLALARKYNAATVFTDSDDYASFADVTGDFDYVRMMRTEPHGVDRLPPSPALDRIAALRKLAWARGDERRWRCRASKPARPPQASERDVFMRTSSAARRERAPAAAMALIERLP